MADSRRGPVLTTFAVLFSMLAISNFSKPFHLSSDVGFVFFGIKTHGVANAVLAPAFGLMLAVYAIGIWRMRRWVLPIAWGYAAYVIVNLSLYSNRNAGIAQSAIGDLHARLHSDRDRSIGLQCDSSLAAPR